MAGKQSKRGERTERRDGRTRENHENHDQSQQKQRSSRTRGGVRLRNARHARIAARQLEPHPLNFRIHTDGQKTALTAILEEVGFVGALLVRPLKRDRYQVLDGHERLTRFRPADEVPCLVVDLTDAEARKVLATFDQIGAMAGIDRRLLQELSKEIEFSHEVLDAMVEDALNSTRAVEADVGGAPADPDAVPLPPDKANTRRGDLWILGEHRLLCGDSSAPADLDRLLGGAAIHLVNTDPPYNVKVEPRSNNAIAAGLSSFAGTRHHQSLDLARHPGKSKPTQQKLRAKDRPLENDFVSDAEFDRLLLAWFGNVARVLVPGGGFYIWGGYANTANYPPALKASGLYLGWKEGSAHRFFGPANVPDVWEVEPDAALKKSIDLGEGVSLRDAAANAAIHIRPGAGEGLAAHNVVAGVPAWIRYGASDVWRVKKICPRLDPHRLPADGPAGVPDGAGSAVLRRDRAAVRGVHRAEGSTPGRQAGRVRISWYTGNPMQTRRRGRR